MRIELPGARKIPKPLRPIRLLVCAALFIVIFLGCHAALAIVCIVPHNDAYRISSGVPANICSDAAAAYPSGGGKKTEIKCSGGVCPADTVLDVVWQYTGFTSLSPQSIDGFSIFIRSDPAKAAVANNSCYHPTVYPAPPAPLTSADFDPWFGGGSLSDPLCGFDSPTAGWKVSGADPMVAIMGEASKPQASFLLMTLKFSSMQSSTTIYFDYDIGEPYVVHSSGAKNVAGCSTSTFNLAACKCTKASESSDGCYELDINRLPDTVPPVISFNAPADLSWQTATIALNIGDSDADSGLARCEYMVESHNGTAWSTTKSWTARTCNSATSAAITLGASGDCRNEGGASGGVCRVGARNFDNDGNVSATISRSFKIDWTAPAVAFNSPAASAWQSATFTINIADTDATSGLSSCDYMVESYNGLAWRTTKNWSARTCDNPASAAIAVGPSVDCANEGSPTMDYCRATARASDAAGNVATAQRTFKIDWASPTAGTVTPLNHATLTYVDSPFDLSADFTDAGSGLASCRFCKSTDGVCDTEWADATPNPGSCSATGITCADGQTVTLDMRASDYTGKTTDAAPVSRICDASGPTGGALDYTNGFQNSNAVSARYAAASDSRSGIASFVTQYQSATLGAGECSAFGAWNNTPLQPPSPASGTLTFSATSGKCYKFQYVLTDGVENQSVASSTNIVKIDSAGPAVAWIAPDASSWHGTDFPISVNDDDPVSGLSTCEYMVESFTGSAWATTRTWTPRACGSATATITVGAAGDCRNDTAGSAAACRVSLRATDNIGNVSFIPQRAFQIDRVPPVAGAVTPSNKAASSFVGASFDLKTAFTDIPCGVSSCQACNATDGVCDTEWATATWSAGNCSATSLTCADGNALTLNMRAADGAGNIAAATPATRTCDTQPPVSTVTYPPPAATMTAAFTLGVSDIDAKSGVSLCEYMAESFNGVAWTVTKNWSPRVCDSLSSVSISVGAVGDCRYNGQSACRIAVRATDPLGNKASGASQTIVMSYTIDVTPPSQIATVSDGPAADILFATSASQLSANWTPSSDPESGIAYYMYAVGTSPGATDVVYWITGKDNSTSATVTGLSLLQSRTYYFTVKAVNGGGLMSTPANSNGQMSETTPPTQITVVNDGPGADIKYSTSSTSLSANWPAASDPESGVVKYIYAVGSAPNSADVVGWTDNALNTSVSLNGLNLADGLTCHVSVKALNGAGLTSTATFSNGQTVNVSPPGDVSELTAVGGDARISLSWTNPSDADFAGVRVVRNTSHTPANISDGVIACIETGSSCVDSGLSNDVVYYYAAFAYDEAFNFAPAASPGSRITAQPARPAFIINRGWNHVGVAKENVSLNPAQIFASGSFEIIKAGAVPEYFPKTAPSNLSLGKSYWIYSDSDIGEISVGGSDFSGASQTIALAFGWNAFASPFPRSFPWSDSNASFKCGGVLMPLPQTYNYSAAKYSIIRPNSINMIIPWKAYWVYSGSSECVLIISK